MFETGSKTPRLLHKALLKVGYYVPEQEMFDLFGGGTDIAMSPPDRKWKLMRKLTHTAIR